MLRSLSLFLLALTLLFMGGLSASAQNGGQTLADIIARQNGQIVVPTPSEGRTVTAPALNGPLGPLGAASDSDLWRALRGNNPLDVTAAPSESQVMQRSGQLWRKIREDVIRKYAGFAPLVVIGLLLIYHLAFGKMKITDGFSGKTIPRFNHLQRVSHWFMAFVFITLGMTGLLILLGRPIIAPYLGLEANSIVTSAAKEGHNLFGPLFIIALVWMFFKFIKGNFFQWVDIKWMLKFGGIFGGHVSSSQFNFGEKSWFWMVILVGIVMSITGVALLFPWIVEDMRLLQLSVILHGLGGMLLLSVMFGHIYLGTIGMEGSIDSMLKGEVDENWAKEHHDLWYEEVTGKTATEKSDTEDTK